MSKTTIWQSACVRNIARILTTCSLGLPLSAGWAEVNFNSSSLPRVTYDFAKRLITLYGYAQLDPKSPVSGLDLELEARKDGLAYMDTHLESSCEGQVKSGRFESRQLQPEWVKNFKSQGSEIYSDGAFQISLSGSFSDIFRSVYPTRFFTPKTENGDYIGLILPIVTPKSVHCGLLSLQIGNREVYFLPNLSSAVKPKKIISLMATEAGSLAPTLVEDGEVLSKSSLSAALSHMKESEKIVFMIPTLEATPKNPD